MPQIGDATKIWEANTRWSANTNCAVWNGKNVDVWVCLRDHISNAANAPPNAHFWRFLGSR
ncbi:hypothetical protein FISHEDRAFT_68395 [Fistulina hepatica ATCC 64428]|uniref:Uncharacterized protein n=1 Tax=Fistulina hepatica ATCC 64428 TaxID=1128425 RepID=A0A0D7ARQ1_9AGAR|nr:hypothetical protein FISHEDRAFT_68395 [Fistulina hepatica ATCC 64428]